MASADAGGGTSNSPGVSSGTLVQARAHVPVNACGNTVSVVGVLNHTTDILCTNI
jgi:precorrin-2 methylase